MLRKIRVILAALCFVLITLVFLDFTGAIHGLFGWLAKVQLLPAILAVNVGVIVAIVLFTLLFGRVYCSVICPLGVMQDGISWAAGKRKKNRFRYSKAKSWLRWSVLALFVIALVAGIGVVVSLLDPYAAYGRIAAELLAPIYRLGNNLLAWIAERMDSYAFYSTEVWIKSGITFGVALLTLLVVGVLTWRNGRTYCNTICPVGTTLGFLSRFSIFRPAFDTEKCTKCSLCEKNCKASCIDYKNQNIDYSRCVSCMNCIEACKFDAMKYTSRRTKPSQKEQPAKAVQEFSEEKEGGMTRRSFLTVTGLFAATAVLKSQQLQVDGGLAEIEDKMIPDRKTPVVPPGGQGAAHMKQHCTACLLCVSSCPNNILRPSNKLSTLMQPEMTFERGFCRPECIECSQVCPTGAIKSITAADKSAISIGQAVWIEDNCVVNTDGKPCTACERHCPTGAIALVAKDPDNPRSLKVPAVYKELCIGCGACEYHCPARPFGAIYVEGNVRHHWI